IGSTLLLAVPNELTREVLQNQIKGSLDLALREVFGEDVLCAISIDTDLTPVAEEERELDEPVEPSEESR
ncbi:hypothetical protein LAQ72_27560, partial [Escherichia coli]|nr:hypothetical protein [Escherichia coli]